MKWYYIILSYALFCKKACNVLGNIDDWCIQSSTLDLTVERFQTPLF